MELSAGQPTASDKTKLTVKWLHLMYFVNSICTKFVYSVVKKQIYDVNYLDVILLFKEKKIAP